MSEQIPATTHAASELIMKPMPDMLEDRRRPTLRPTNDAMESMMGHRFQVLDHGFIELQDYMGDQNAILEAARNSYQQGTKSFREDRGLIRYLMRKRHTSPFEMAEIKLHVKLPIFVARQWVRHRTASINEVSARYSVLEKEFYIPSAEDLGTQSTTNMQGREEGGLTPRQAEAVRNLLFEEAVRSYDDYEILLGEQKSDDFGPNYPGISRELARMNLSLNFYTRWTWKTDVHNFMHFLSLRNDKHAQLEIKRYAEIMDGMLRMWMPQVAEAFDDYRTNAVTFSGPAMTVLRQIMSDLRTDDRPISQGVVRHELGKVLEKRELQETMEALGIPFE